MNNSDLQSANSIPAWGAVARAFHWVLGVAIIGSVFSSQYAPAVTSNLSGLPLPASALSAGWCCQWRVF